MKLGDVIWKFFAALPALVFWLSYFQSSHIDGSENWLRFAVLSLTTLLSAALLVVSLIFALRARIGVWWLIATLHLSVVVMFFFN